jgi:isopenicillin-N epimerase
VADDQADPREYFALDWADAHLNHGSFGAVPVPVTQAQQALRDAIEANPHRFFSEDYEPLLARNRTALAKTLCCDPDGLVFVRNVTEGITAAAAAVRLSAGDEVVTTAHEYDSLLAMWERLCASAGARLRVVDLPIGGEDEWAHTLLAHVTSRTRVLYLSHISSSTALMLPVSSILAGVRGADIVTIVDAAHIPGQVDIEISALPVDVYVGNLHKWAMHPRGAGFMYASERVRGGLPPALHSWYYSEEAITKRFSWLGTADPTPWLIVEAVQGFHHLAQSAGWRQRAQSLSEQAEQRLSGIPGLLPLPSGPSSRAPYFFALSCGGWTAAELRRHIRNARIWAWAGTWNGQDLLRVSTTYYNRQEDIDRLVEVLSTRKPGP